MDKKATNKPPKKAAEELISVHIKTHKDKNGGHPHAIMIDLGNNHVSVGFTHKKFKGKNHPNYALEQNPLGGNDTAYMRRQGTVAPKSEYVKPRKGKMSPKDYDKAQQIAERAKQKYLREKKGKKK